MAVITKSTPSKFKRWVLGLFGSNVNVAENKEMDVFDFLDKKKSYSMHFSQAPENTNRVKIGIEQNGKFSYVSISKGVVRDFLIDYLKQGKYGGSIPL